MLSLRSSPHLLLNLPDCTLLPRLPELKVAPWEGQRTSTVGSLANSSVHLLGGLLPDQNSDPDSNVVSQWEGGGGRARGIGGGSRTGLGEHWGILEGRREGKAGVGVMDLKPLVHLTHETLIRVCEELVGGILKRLGRRGRRGGWGGFRKLGEGNKIVHLGMR